MSINKATLIGNLGKNPDVRNANGATLVRFTLATTRKGFTTQAGVNVPEKTNWHNIFCRGKVAEVAAQYLHQGDRVYLEGEINYDEYTDKQGIKRAYTEIVCDKLEMLTPKGQSGQQAPQPQQQQSQPQPMYQQPPVAQPVQQYQAPVQQQGVYGQPAQAQPAQQPAQTQMRFDSNGNPCPF